MSSRVLASVTMCTFALGVPACGQPMSGPVTPTGSTPEATGWRKSVVVAGLEHPWGLAFLPDGSMLITERSGALRIVRNGKLDPTPIKGVPAVLTVRQGGLLDVSLHPDFTTNNLVYLTYSVGGSGSNHTRLARATFDGTALNDLQVLFDAEPDKPHGFHFGSRIAWMSDGTMLLSIGDGGGTRDKAQDLGTHLGKVLRLKDDGSTATGNPFFSRLDARPEVWSYGHRNIQGLTIDPQGNVWATEHGPRGGDELNLVVEGKNYGWPKVTYGLEYHGPRISDRTSMQDAEDPKVVWTPCIAPSGLAYYTGDKFPQWKGDLFAGGLVLEQVRRIDLDGTSVVKVETLTIGKRVRDVRQGPDGLLYLLTDEERGELIRIEPDAASN